MAPSAHVSEEIRSTCGSVASSSGCTSGVRVVAVARAVPSSDPPDAVPNPAACHAASPPSSTETRSWPSRRSSRQTRVAQAEPTVS